MVIKNNLLRSALVGLMTMALPSGLVGAAGNPAALIQEDPIPLFLEVAKVFSFGVVGHVFLIIGLKNLFAWASSDRSSDLQKATLSLVDIKTPLVGCAASTDISTLYGPEITAAFQDDVGLMAGTNFKALQLAIFGYDLAVLQKIVDAGVDVNGANCLGKTPLIYAATHGNGAVVKVLLDAGAKVNVIDSAGWSALAWAVVHNGDIATIELLLRAGAQVNMADIDGITILEWAQRKNDDHIVQMLRNAHAQEVID